MLGNTEVCRIEHFHRNLVSEVPHLIRYYLRNGLAVVIMPLTFFMTNAFSS